MSETPVMSVRVPGLVVDPLLEALTRQLMMKSRDARPASAKAVHALVDLIDRDRPAAAAALGVELDPDEGLATAARSPEPARGHPRPPSADVTQQRYIAPAKRAASVDPPADLVASITAETAQIAPVWSRRARLAIAAGAVLAVLVALILTLRSQRPVAPTPPAPPRASTIAVTPSIDAGIAEPLAPAEPLARTPDEASGEPPAKSVAKPSRLAARSSAVNKPLPPPGTPAIEPPPPVAAPDPPAPAVDLMLLPPPATSASAPWAAPETPVAVSASAPAPSALQLMGPASAATVARLYSTVGKELKALDNARGSAATADLWLLYLRVRINDVIADPVKRAEADLLLHHLDDQVIQRSR
jgi:hypothetical protein